MKLWTGLLFFCVVVGSPVTAEPTHWTAILGAGYSRGDEGPLSNWDNACEALATRLGPRVDRVIVLTSQEFSLSALERALDQIPSGPHEGLVLFLTSHGARNRGWVLEHDGPGGPQTILSPRALGRDLARTIGARRAVILLSACFSGQFLDESLFKQPTWVVLTAARRDRSSFGCGAGFEMPEWDESLIRLWQTNEPGEAWSDLTERIGNDIGTKERSQGESRRSFPQSWVGPAVDYSTSLRPIRAEGSAVDKTN